ncbi:minor capsid protein [Paenibacillus pinisoli]|nr:minor capsid protein [Paenibacillus pinisoli]
MENLNEAELKRGEDYIRVQRLEYDKAMARIQKETQSWYGRLAENNNVSMAQARKLLGDNELQEFRWSLEDYIKAGRENAVDQRWIKQLENASAKVHITRLEELETKIQQEVELLAASRVKGTSEVLGNIYKDGYYKGIYEVQRGTEVGVPFAKLDVRQIDKVLAKPWAPDGRNFSERIWGDRDKLLNELQTVLTQDLIRGEPSDRVIADFADKMGVSKSAAERLVLTEAAYFSGQSRIDGYRETGVTHYKFVATLDNRTSDKCQGLDGAIIPLEEAEAGVNYPPVHAYCRSTTIPHYDDEKEVGERAARDKDGKTYSVPGNMTYKDWVAMHAPKDALEPVTAATPAPTSPPKVKTSELPQEASVPLTKVEEAAVTRYIDGESYAVNDKLRIGQPLAANEMELVERLDSAISKLPKYTGDVSRSLHFAAEESLIEFLKDIKPGAVLQYPQNISMTAKTAYNPDAQILFYILSAALGADLTKLNPGELEVVYGRDFPFEVVAIEVLNGVHHILLREMMK